ACGGAGGGGDCARRRRGCCNPRVRFPRRDPIRSRPTSATAARHGSRAQPDDDVQQWRATRSSSIAILLLIGDSRLPVRAVVIMVAKLAHSRHLLRPESCRLEEVAAYAFRLRRSFATGLLPIPGPPTIANAWPDLSRNSRYSAGREDSRPRHRWY